MSDSEGKTSSEVSALVARAKLAEQADMFEDMVKAVRELVRSGTEHGMNMRNLVSVAYKNYVGAKRAAWRVLSTVEHREREQGRDDRAKLARRYRTVVEGEIRDVCHEVLGLLKEILLPGSKRELGGAGREAVARGAR